MDISVILPTKEFKDSVLKVLESLSNQTLKPAQVIIIDSSKNNMSAVYTKQFDQKLNLHYFHSSSCLYPGEARNKGIQLAKFETIAFVDSKTIPDKTWLEKSYNKLIFQYN